MHSGSLGLHSSLLYTQQPSKMDSHLFEPLLMPLAISFMIEIESIGQVTLAAVILVEK
jgi:hypothetical protein